MIIANFTPEEVPWSHIGVQGILLPGEIVEMADARGNHILNKVSRRGILRIEYGTDQEQYKKEALKIYKNFWMLQISNFNQLNESRKNENKPFVHPTQQLAEHAKELRVKLVAPYEVLQAAADGRVSNLESENKDLKEAMGEMKQQIRDLTSLLKSGSMSLPKDTEDIEEADDAGSAGNAGEDVTEKRKPKFAWLNKGNFAGWLTRNTGDIVQYPEEDKEELRTQWDKHFPGKTMPNEILVSA